MSPLNQEEFSHEPFLVQGMTTLKTILIAEDNEDSLFLLARLLRRSGYSVVEAQDGLEALAQLKESKPDLLLLDLMMPGLSGFEVLERFQEEPERQTVPVIVLSTLADSEVIGQCTRLGVCDYITKPYDPADLLRRISDVLMQPSSRHLPGGLT
jgi:twitching motility two-component system response regulator PilH